MKTFSEKLKYYREQRGMSQEKLAKIVGISSRTLQNYEKGDKEPTIGIAKKIANALEISLSELINDKSINFPQTGDALKKAELNTKIYVDNKLKVTDKENGIEVNYYPEVYAAAGYGAVNSDYPTVEKMHCDLNFFASILNIKNPNNGVDIIKVIGDSMEPFISNGEIVIIEKTFNAQNGDIVIANINGNVYVKRLEKDPFNKWVKLISENPEYETIKLEGDELNYLQIVGIVRAKIRPF